MPTEDMEIYRNIKNSGNSFCKSDTGTSSLVFRFGASTLLITLAL